MTFYDYKVAPAPKELRRIKGLNSTAEIFAATLAEAINASAREGWEYVRAETLPAVERARWFRRGTEVIETVLVFRRPRETLSPRLASARLDPAPSDALSAEPQRLGGAEPAMSAAERREPARGRREPRVGEGAAPSTPLRPAPRLGPADPG